MRIAFVTPEYVTEPNFHGGLAKYLHHVSLILKELGHEPLIIVATNCATDLEHDGIRVFRVNAQTRRNPLSQVVGPRRFQAGAWIWQSWKLNQKLREINRQNKIDLAQFASYTATALFRPRFIPSVGRLSSLQTLWDEAYELPKSKVRALMQYLEIKSLERTDKLICPGRVVGRAAEQLTRKEVTIIENPYVSASLGDSDRQLYKELLEGKEYLLFFGSIGLLKGVKTIADIIHHLLQRHPSLFFVFAGKDMMYRDKPMMDFVWNEAGRYRNRVLYLGTIPRSQLCPVIEYARAVVLPSRIDNFPNACLESMAYGKIVIGTKGASFEQLIIDGQNGLLCEINDSGSLLSAVERGLALTAEQRELMGSLAKKRVNHLTSKKAVHKLLEVYREVACL